MIETAKNTMLNLRLHGMLKTLDLRMKEAEEHGWSYSDLLSALTTDERTYRQQKNTEYKIKRAKFRIDADFDHYDYSAKRSITKTQIKQLMELSFIKTPQTLLLLGPTGIGKTFIASALGKIACTQGYSCFFIGMNLFIEQALMTRTTGTFLKFRDRLVSCDLLILDDLGIKALDASAIQDLYDVLEERYQNKATIITSQLPLTNWKEVIADKVALEAILDRVIHGKKIEITGDSYRKKRELDKIKGTSGN